jgi:hypothetical protein
VPLNPLKEVRKMAKYEKFSVTIMPPQHIEIGSMIRFENKMIIVTGLTKVEYVTSRLVQVSGKGTV